MANLAPSCGHLAAILRPSAATLRHMPSEGDKHVVFSVKVHLGCVALEPHASEVDFD